ncbi:MAG: hypothetical protein K8F52_09900 [Candidatus Scalindua rubra]|nr:hypothetical protein [Candidatus Scalindua rubra]TWU36399.1 hypothetical protein S225a_06780 [Candidatus Brocadiaceae bacterium S225]
MLWNHRVIDDTGKVGHVAGACMITAGTGRLSEKIEADYSEEILNIRIIKKV